MSKSNFPRLIILSHDLNTQHYCLLQIKAQISAESCYQANVMPSFYDPLIRYIYLDTSKGYLQASFPFLELFIFRTARSCRQYHKPITCVFFFVFLESFHSGYLYYIDGYKKWNRSSQTTVTDIKTPALKNCN